jgi:uncharacterized protein YukE
LGNVQQAAVAPAQPEWPNIKWRDKFAKLSPLLQGKMSQHHNMVEDCKERSNEIRRILERRRNSITLAPSLLAGAAATHEQVEDLKTERLASRLRHALATLKSSLQHDSWELQRQHDHAVRQKRLLNNFHARITSTGGTNALSGLDTHAQHHSLVFLQETGKEMHEDMERMKEVMTDLELVLVGSINRPSQYPPELIEQVLWQSERLWHAMSAKVALQHAQTQRARHEFTGVGVC